MARRLSNGLSMSVFDGALFPQPHDPEPHPPCDVDGSGDDAPRSWGMEP
jgi:hypothetical protein